MTPAFFVARKKATGWVSGVCSVGLDVDGLHTAWAGVCEIYVGLCTGSFRATFLMRYPALSRVVDSVKLISLVIEFNSLCLSFYGGKMMGKKVSFSTEKSY